MPDTLASQHASKNSLQWHPCSSPSMQVPERRASLHYFEFVAHAADVCDVANQRHSCLGKPGRFLPRSVGLQATVRGPGLPCHPAGGLLGQQQACCSCWWAVKSSPAVVGSFCPIYLNKHKFMYLISRQRAPEIHNGNSALVTGVVCPQAVRVDPARAAAGTCLVPFSSAFTGVPRWQE